MSKETGLDLLICINYHCSPTIKNMLASVPVENRLHIDVCIVDNSGEFASEYFDQSSVEFAGFEILTPGQNLGYLNGAHHAVISKGIRIDAYRSITIANPDILFAKTFWNRLSVVLKNSDNVGVVFPCVFDTHEKRDVNPFLRDRPPRSYLDTRIRAFSSRLSFLLWNIASKIKRRLKPSPSNDDSLASDIYAGHGAYMIFTPAFFERDCSFERPIFLYSEELYIAESCRAAGLRCRHEPRLQTTHISHATTSLVPSESRRVWVLESLEHIRDTYY